MTTPKSDPTLRGKRYAGSNKTAEQTLSDIRASILKAGGYNFGYKENGNVVSFEFEHDGLLYRFLVETPGNNAAERARKWRVVYDVITSDLLAIKEEIATMQSKFFVNIVDTDTNQTFGEMHAARLEEMKRKALPPGT